MELKKLKSCYPLFSNGIFTLIRFYSSQEQSLFSTWLTSDKAEDLDVQLIGEYGDKPVSPLIFNLLENGSLTDASKLNISRYIYNKFKTNWEHYLKIDLADYDILKPYNITEVYDEDSNVNTTKTGTVSNEATNTNTGTDNLSKTINQTDRFSGSDSMAKTGTVTNEATNTNTGTDNLSKTVNQTDRFSGTDSQSKTGTETEVLDRTNDTTTTTDRSETGTSDSTDNAYTFGFNTGNDPVGTNRGVNDTDTTASVDETVTNNTDEDSTNTTTYNITDTTNYGKINTQTGTNSDNRTLNLQETKDNTETYNTTDTTTYGKINTQTGTNSDNRTLNLQETRNNTEINNLENNEDITKDSTTTRTGNIGNHSFTELLAKELEFWDDFNIQNKIFKDVISVLVLPIYQIDI